MSAATFDNLLRPIGTALPARRRISLTQVLSLSCAVLTAGFVLGLVVLFAWQAAPVLRHSGWGYLLDAKWHFPSKTFGAAAMIYGTVVVSAVALMLATPVGILAAVFTSEFLPPRVRLAVKLVIELLAGVPSVVYGLLGILYLRNFVYDGLERFDPLSGDTLLTAGILLAVMILPTVMTLSDDALRGVGAMQRQAARAMGLSRVSAVWRVVVPQARAGLLAAVLLALGRALGETIAVFLVVGRQDGQFPSNLLSLRPLMESGQTLTSKLGGAEINIAYGDPLHWAAVVGLGLILLVMVGAITFTGAWLETRGRPCSRHPTRTPSRFSAVPEPVQPLPRAAGAPTTARGMVRRRRAGEFLSIALCAAAALLACATLFAIVVAIFYRGGSALNWRFFTEQIRLVGADGGIFYNLVGTLILIATASAVAVPVAGGVALAQGVFVRSGRAQRWLSLVLYALNGVPSILFGILGLIVFVKLLGWGKSWLTGGILLGVMILPTVTVALYERIKVLPAKYLEAARGMGLSRSQAVWSVVLPQTWGGLVTGTLLGLARAAGETAPIMFTATIFAGATFPTAIRESPVLSLPYHIFILAQDSFDPRVGSKLWGAAAVLLILVFAMSLIALPLRQRTHEEANHA